jgi:REP element-mobilizing transposase RayT
MNFLNWEKEIKVHGDKLPHWQQENAMQFVTFRLADSLPKSLLEQWKSERDIWLGANPKPWNPATESLFHQLFTGKLEQWLDEGMGEYLLRSAQVRDVVQEVLMKFHGQRVIHESWVMMPNHVHLLFTPLVPMSKLIQAWKSVSAQRLARGAIWQRNYRDTMIRDSAHYRNVVRYIRHNPMKVSLAAEEYTLWEGDSARRIE